MYLDGISGVHWRPYCSASSLRELCKVSKIQHIKKVRSQDGSSGGPFLCPQDTSLWSTKRFSLKQPLSNTDDRGSKWLCSLMVPFAGTAAFLIPLVQGGPSCFTFCLSVYTSSWRAFVYHFIVACHLPRAPSYDGGRTWVEGSQTNRGVGCNII